MRRFAGSCRFVYNHALALQKANYEAGGSFIGYVAMWLSGCRATAEHQSDLPGLCVRRARIDGPRRISSA
jgi:hypothetical protein